MAKKEEGASFWAGMDLIDHLLIIVLGVIFLFVNLGLMDSEIIKYWPIFLIVWGFKELIQTHR